MRNYKLGIHIYILILCFSKFSIAQNPQFIEKQRIKISSSASEIKFVSINEDAIPDFFLRYQAVDIQFGWLNGKDIKSTSLKEKNIPKPDNYALSAFGYLNNDSIPDFVTSSYWNNGFLVYLGLGGGNFSAGQFYQSGIHGNRIEIADINNDNKNDVVAVTSGSGQPIVLHVFTGNGLGALSRIGSFTSGSATPKGLYVFDKNKDGLLDVLVTTSFPEFLIFFQKENLQFKPKYFHTNQNSDMLTGDLDNDGNPEMVLIYSNYEYGKLNDSIVVWQGKADSTYGTRKKMSPNLYLDTGMPSLIDINNDGKKDLILKKYNDLDPVYHTDSLFVCINDSAGGFGNHWVLKTPQKVYSYLFGDFDSDLDTDLAFVSTDSEFVYLENKIIENCDENSAFGYTYTVLGSNIHFTTKHENARNTIWINSKTNETLLGNNFTLQLNSRDTLKFQLSYQVGDYCSFATSASILVDTLITNTNDDTKFENLVQLFPVPATDFVNIQCLKRGKLEIMDLLGVSLLNIDFESNSESIKINLDNWKPGVYIYNFTSEKSSEKGKMMNR